MNHNYAHKVLLLVVLGVVAGPMIGCPAGTTQGAAKASLQATIILRAAQDGEIAAHNAGQIPDADHQFIQRQFQSLFEADKAANDCISQANNKQATFHCIDTASQTVEGIQKEGGLAIKSESAKASFNLTITSVQSVLQTIEVTLGGGQ